MLPTTREHERPGFAEQWVLVHVLASISIELVEGVQERGEISRVRSGNLGEVARELACIVGGWSGLSALSTCLDGRLRFLGSEVGGDVVVPECWSEERKRRSLLEDLVQRGSGREL